MLTAACVTPRLSATDDMWRCSASAMTIQCSEREPDAKVAISLFDRSFYHFRSLSKRPVDKTRVCDDKRTEYRKIDLAAPQEVNFVRSLCRARLES
jgi:hypothetical protein